MIKNQMAEQSVLGILLYEGLLIKEVTLLPEHFSEKRHMLIYRAILNLYQKDDPINMVSITTELGTSLREAGGVTYMTDLAASVPTTHSLKHDQRLVLEAYRHRKMKAAAINYAKNPSDKALDELCHDVEVYRKMGMEKEDRSHQEILVDIVNEMKNPPEEGMTGFATGYEELDQMTGGTQRGDLTILAARPSMGKTAFALNLASNHCKQGGSVQLFSLEMSVKPLLQRMISSEALVDGQKWRTMKFSNQDYLDTIDVVGPISEWHLKIDTKSRTVSDIRAKIRSTLETAKNKRHLVIIDYLQLISSTTRFERRDLEIGNITRELKLLALELDIPIILLSQLSRNVEQRQDKRPLLSDLRESGNIEQDADMIAFLYREDYYKWHQSSNKIELIIGKQRNGPVGKVDLHFEKEYGKFNGNVHNAVLN